MSFGPGDFVLPVDKPEGPTSHDVVAQARRALGTRKVGHTGTLDPFASGLLMLCVGKSTRLAEYLSGMDKSYEASARLGVETDTLDREGTVVSTSEAWRELTAADIAEALEGFVGEVDQVPPQFSAKKVDGEAMHRRARRGEHIELPPVRVRIHEVEVLSADLPDVRFAVRSSSGTYIRAIARDLGRALGVGAHLTQLRRTAVGDFDVDRAVAAGELDQGERVRAVALTPTQAVAHLDAVEIGADDARRLLHGQRIRFGSGGEGEAGAVAVSHEGSLLAIAELDGGVLKPRKVFGS